LNYGAPHIGIPLIKGYLNNNNINCEVRDLNLETVLDYNISISEAEIRAFQSSFDPEIAYKFYFSFADKLSVIAKKFNGEWNIKSGFIFDGCDFSSSNDIEEYSKIKSPFTEFYLKNVIPDIIDKQYSIIGISIAVPSQLLSAFEICRLIRKTGYTGLIVLGGNTITRLKNELYLDWVFNIIDCIALNQGEKTLKLIIELTKNRKSFENIPNLLWKDGNVIKYTGYKKLEENEFSMPNFNGFPIGEYWGVNYLPVIAARGCYYSKCNFCSIPYAWGNNGFIGLDNPINVINYIKTEVLNH